MQAWHRATAALLLTLAAAGCDCGQKVQKVDPALGDVPDELPFGLVAVGDSFSQTLQLKAITNADLKLTAKIEEADSPFQLDAAAPELIPGNGQVELSITFTPPAVDTFAATLVISTDDPDKTRGSKRIVLSGTGKSPQVSVTPDHLDFSAIACPGTAHSDRCTDQKSVTVENVGEVRLSLDKVEIQPKEGGSIPAGLALAKLVSTSSLEPGEKLDVPIRWKPLPANVPGPGGADFEAKLVVPSNDPAKPKVEVPLIAHADPNKPPVACVQVLEITRKVFKTSTDSQGRVVVTPATEGVPASEYTCASAADQCVPGEIQVRPGMTVKLTTQGVDGSGQPCTADPEGDAISYSWNISARPDESRARATPDGQAATQVEIDAVGKYTVAAVVRDSLQLAGKAEIVLNAIPRDDISVQLAWQDSSGVDLDLHLLADAGPNTTVPGRLFCGQDCFFYNPAPNWFDPASPNDDPHFLRDDQGSAGQLETAGLVAAPPGSRFRVAVHEYDQGASSAGVVPKVSIRLKGAVFGPFSPTTPLAGTDDVWIAAELVFPETGAPTATALQQHLAPTDAPDPAAGQYTRFNGSVGACE